ncbi:MAG: phytoene desaturase family protein, partial [Gaiellaceae bacterium]
MGAMAADVVVAGAGHNALIAAAYLAKAGHEVLLLDARSTAGGAAATEELTLPGFHFDSCSTGHTLIQPNPLLRDDELGLKSVYGLEYVSPDPIAHVVFPDGESFTHWLDLDRTLEEISRFSKRDAETYRRGLDEFADIRPQVGAYRFNPIGYAPPLDVALADRPRWLRRIASSAYDVIRREYESRYIQSYLLWQAFQTAQPVDSPGSGLLAYSIVAGRQERSWTLPRGGSGELPRALLDCLADHGATVLCDKRVVELVVEGGRCAGVVTEDGERYLARRAVLSTIHVKPLVDMAPTEAWGDDF